MTIRLATHSGWTAADLPAATDDLAVYLGEPEGGGDDVLASLTRLRALRGLTLSGLPNLTRDGLADLARAHPGLTRLTLNNLSRATDHELAPLAALPLARLRMTGVPSAAGDWIGACSGVTELSLNRAVPPAALAALVALERAHLFSCDLTAAHLAALATLPRLRSLVIELGSLEPGALEALRSAPALEHLRVTTRAPNAAEVDALAAVRSLRAVDVAADDPADLAPLALLDAAHDRCALGVVPRRLSDALFARLPEVLPHLAMLDLDHPQVAPPGRGDVTAEGLAPLGRLGALRWASFECFVTLLRSVAAPHFAWLASLSQLESLKLQLPLKLKSKAADLVSGLTALRALELSWAAPSDASIKRLAALPQLARLALLNAPLMNKGFEALGRMGSLTTLRVKLDDGALSDAGLAALAAAPKLGAIELGAYRASPVSVTSFAALAAMPELRDLRWGFVQDAPSIDDAMVASLAGSRSLERVDFGSNTRIALGDEGFAALGSMPALRRVGLEGGKPSRAALDALDAQGRPLVGPPDYFDTLTTVGPWAPP